MGVKLHEKIIEENIDKIIDLDFQTDEHESLQEITTEDAIAIGFMVTCFAVVVLALLAICITSLLDHYNVVNVDNLMNRRLSNENLPTIDGVNPSTPTFIRFESGPPPSYNTLFVSVINVPPPTYQDAINK